MDCIFSSVEEQLSLPTGRDGGCWHFTHPTLPLAFHHHRELELNLVTQGRATYLLDDRRYVLRAGTLVWLFPAQNHILLDRSPDFAMWILVIRPALATRLCADGADAVLCAANPPEPYCRHLPWASANRVSALLREAATIADGAHFNAALAYALLTAWAAYSMAGEEEPGCPLHPAVKATVRRLREETAPTTCQQLAAEYGLSASRLSSLFKEQTGVALARYRNQQRLRRFLQICAAPGEAKPTLLQAALEAGFGSYAQFYRVFHETMGCPPAEYRPDPKE